ncbi:hypothetical protein JCM6882_006826 [Rhodosporidiobolus microsporus]
MQPPPVGASHAAVLQWLTDSGFVTNLSALVNQFNRDVLEQAGMYALRPEHLLVQRYLPATTTTPAFVEVITGGIPMRVVRRLETLPRGQGECYTEWVFPHRGDDDGERGHSTAWGPDFYRQEHYRMDGLLQHQTRRVVQLNRCSAPGRQIKMEPLNNDRDHYRIDPPIPLHQRFQHPHGVPDPSLPSFPKPPHFSLLKITYTYRIRLPRGSTPPFQDHALVAAVRFINPHTVSPRPPTAEAATPPVNPRLARVLSWNNRTETGEESEWEHDEMGGRAETPAYLEDPAHPNEHTFGLIYPLDYPGGGVHPHEAAERMMRRAQERREGGSEEH